MARRRRWTVVVAVGAAAVFVAVNPLERDRRAEGGDQGALLGESWRIRLASAEVAEDLARREYALSLDAHARDGMLDRDPYLTELVASVVEPLVIAAKDLYPQTRDWAWEWHVADTDQRNAWCLPGSRMMVLSGLLAEDLLGGAGLWLTGRSLGKCAPAWSRPDLGWWPRWKWVANSALPCTFVWLAFGA